MTTYARNGTKSSKSDEKTGSRNDKKVLKSDRITASLVEHRAGLPTLLTSLPP